MKGFFFTKTRFEKRHKTTRKRPIPLTITVLQHIQLRSSVPNDNETDRIFPQHPLISFKRDKNRGNFIAKSMMKSDVQLT